MRKTLIKNARVVLPQGKPQLGWLLIEGELIAQVGKGDSPATVEADEVIDFAGDYLMPGMIDTHVHFREPGLEHKACIATESAAAVAGGVTSFFDMPNTNPPTVTLEAWEDKMQRAAAHSLANYAFYIGATNDNLDSVLLKMNPTQVPGVKLFLGSSTGNLLMDSQDALDRLMAEIDLPIAVHAEDNARIAQLAAIAREVFGSQPIPMECHSLIRDSRACFDSTLLALNMALKHNARLHICHLSTAAEVRLLRELKTDRITAETCVHYLEYTDGDYDALGARLKCNPAVKASSDRTALRKAVKEGVIDLIGSDHAPHQLSEKEGDGLTAPSGMPGIQFQLPLLMDLYPADVVARITAAAPAKIFGIDKRGAIAPGMYADLVRMAEVDEYTITDSMSQSRCGWTAQAGLPCRHRVEATWVNGSMAYPSLAAKAARPLTFTH